jgi:hypothetical protein
MQTVDEHDIRSASDIEFTHLRAYGLRRGSNVLRGAEERRRSERISAESVAR